MIQNVLTYLRPEAKNCSQISIAVRLILFDFEAQTSKRDNKYYITAKWRPNILLPSSEAITIEHSRNGMWRRIHSHSGRHSVVNKYSFCLLNDCLSKFWHSHVQRLSSVCEFWVCAVENTKSKYNYYLFSG